MAWSAQNNVGYCDVPEEKSDVIYDITMGIAVGGRGVW
jgi:hypothetical protein